MTRNYETLDALVVVGSLGIVGGTVGGLIFCDVPANNLPIIASLVSALLGAILGGYAGFRWGSSVAAKHDAAVGALAQIAGAGPPPPAKPLDGEGE